MAATRGCGRTRIWRVGLGTAIFAILLFPQLSASAAQDEALSDREYLGPSPADMQDPAVQAEIASDLNELEQARARRQEPDEIAAREAARTAYQDLTANQARDLATRLFPELMLNPTWETYEPPQGQRLVRYYGSESALIKPEDSEVGSLVESTAPLRAEDEAGQLRPVDPALVDRGDYLEPANSAVEAALPEQLSDAIELPEAGLSVKPEGAVEAAPAAVVGEDKVFWANVDTDTDFIATSTPDGIETFWQLRSERSPEQYSLRLDMPPGSSLEPALNGLGAEVIGAEGPEAIVRPPLAFDADGVSVPVEMEPTGNELSLSIAHRSGDFRLPIILDPVVEVVDVWAWGTPCPYGGYSYPFWRWEPEGSRFDPGCSGDWGLVTQTRAGTSYRTNEYAQWVWVPPYDTFLERVEFYNTDFTHGNLDDFCSYHGIWSTQAYAWQSLGGSCTPWAHTDLIHHVGQGGHDNNGAIFQLYSPGDRFGWQLAWTAVRAAKFVISDRNNPVFSTPTPPTQPWRDDTIAGTPQSFSYSAAARDGGLGMKWLTLRRPDRTAGQGVVDQRDRGCAGVQGAFPCTAGSGAYSQNFSYQLSKLPEGMNRIDVTAKDQIDRARTVSWQQPIDRSAPIVNPPTGSLVDNKDGIRADQRYSLTVSASDGSNISSASMRSGVKKIEIFVAGEEEPRKVWEQECVAPEQSCTMPKPNAPPLTWDIMPGEFDHGRNYVQIVATDMLGHVSVPRTLELQVTGDQTEPQITLQQSYGGDPLALRVDVVDPGTVSSGVTHFEVWADGNPVKSENQECPGGGCSMSRIVTLAPDQSPATTQIDVYADDQSGLSTYARAGEKKQRFESFGFNEDFGNHQDVDQKAFLRLASDEGADTIRFYVNWCVVTDPNRGWAYYQRRFDRINYVNVNKRTDDDVELIVMALGAPSNDPNCVTAPPTSGQNAGWQSFVREILTRWGPTMTTDSGTPGNPYDDINYRLKAIEIWNEPNNPQFWGGGDIVGFRPDPARFARLVNLASDVIQGYNNQHPALPDVRAVPGGLHSRLSVPEDAEDTPAEDAILTTYLRKAFDPEAADGGTTINASRINAISIHLYANTERKMESVRTRIIDRSYNPLTAALPDAFKNKNRWITEIGFPAETVRRDPDDPTSGLITRGNEMKQRHRMIEMYGKFATRNAVNMFLVHRVVDNHSNERGRFGVVTQTCARHRLFVPLAREVTGASPPLRPENCEAVAAEADQEP